MALTRRSHNAGANPNPPPGDLCPLLFEDEFKRPVSGLVPAKTLTWRGTNSIVAGEIKSRSVASIFSTSYPETQIFNLYSRAELIDSQVSGKSFISFCTEKEAFHISRVPQRSFPLVSCEKA